MVDDYFFPLSLLTIWTYNDEHGVIAVFLAIPFCAQLFFFSFWCDSSVKESMNIIFYTHVTVSKKSYPILASFLHGPCMVRFHFYRESFSTKRMNLPCTRYTLCVRQEKWPTLYFLVVESSERKQAWMVVAIVCSRDINTSTSWCMRLVGISSGLC